LLVFLFLLDDVFEEKGVVTARECSSACEMRGTLF